MDDLHQHDDMEMNYLLTGKVTYLYRGGVFDLPARRLVAFWGATPHRIVQVADDAAIMVAQAPAAWVMDWDLPRPFVDGFLGGHIVMEPDESRAAYDAALLEAWSADFAKTQTPYKTVLPEMQARTHRLAATSTRPFEVRTGRGVELSRGWRRVEQVAHFVAEHFREQVSIDDIAEGVGLRPSYMMHLFRERCGVSVLAYLTSFRVAHAQFLLVTTDATVLDIALESGFNSLSRFYAAFKETTGLSPTRYRRSFPASSSVPRLEVPERSVAAVSSARRRRM